MADGFLTVSLDQSKLAALQRRLRGIKNGVAKTLAGAANDTAKHTRTSISRSIRDRIKIKKRDIDKHIKIRTANSNDTRPTATVTLSKSRRIGLQYFGAKQIGTRAAYRRAKNSTNANFLGGGGVTYSIGRKFAPGAFMGPKPGVKADSLYGGVFIRVGKGRLPIKKLKGPSPWGVFVKAGLKTETLIEGKAEFDKNIERRVKYLLLKSKGVI